MNSIDNIPSTERIARPAEPPKAQRDSSDKDSARDENIAQEPATDEAAADETAVDEEVIRENGLLLASLRVWELKQGIRE